MPAPTSVQTLPTAAPPVQSNASASISLIGVDVAPFSIDLSRPSAAQQGEASGTATFPNLPYRLNTQNSLNPTVTAAQQPITIAANNQLIFVCFVQGPLASAPTGTVISVNPQAITTKNVYVPGPFLGAESYQTFQAVVDALSPTLTGTVTGFVVGLLFLSNG